MKKTLQKEFKYQTTPNESNTNYQQEKHSNDSSKVNNKHNSQNNNIVKIPSVSTTAAKIQKQHNNVIKLLPDETSLAQNSNNQPFPKSNSNLSHLHDDVNFKYLKHVVLKFLTSREYEVIIFNLNRNFW